jgi:uncharacterized protein (DUF885 family)
MDTKQASPALFRQLLADEWEARMREDPLFATLCGDHRYDDRLPGLSEADFEKRLERMLEFRTRQNEVERSALPPAEQLNYDIFAVYLDREIAELRFRAYRMPISKINGYHALFPQMPQFIPLETSADYENYIARMRAFPRMADDLIDVMRAGLRGGQVPPRVTLDTVDDQLRAQIVEEPLLSRLYRPFERFPKAVPQAVRERLVSEGGSAIMEAVVPGYRALLKFLEEEYLPRARTDIAASGLPDGRAFYAHRIRYHTTLELSADAVHSAGLAEVDRIREEMEIVIRKIGFKGFFREFVEFLRVDSRFYTAMPETLMKEASYILKKIDGELPRLFKTLPRMPYGIREMPEEISPGNTTARYWPPTGDGTHAGIFFVNTFDLKSRPLYELEALSLHEAVPGHHLQLALQRESGDIPNFRRFGDFTAFVEGWALYAERLGLEIGFYEDPYSDFGRLSFEMWRACRLVVDTGMHSLGWTRQQAIDYLVEHTAQTLLNITNEVDRYVGWPGQALAYKTGEMKIRELRRRAEEALGQHFSLREFHDAVLANGAVPLGILDTLVAKWIEERKTNTGLLRMDGKTA